jgi:hypothetical protein
MMVHRFIWITLFAAVGCGGGDDSIDDADAAAGQSDAAAGQPDAAANLVDAIPVQGICTPRTTGLVDSLFEGRKSAGLTIDQDLDTCGLETDVVNPNADRVATFERQDGELGFGSAFGYQVLTTSHGTNLGNYAGPLPDLTLVTVRLNELSPESDTWDIVFRFDEGAGECGEVTVAELTRVVNQAQP